MEGHLDRTHLLGGAMLTFANCARLSHNHVELGGASDSQMWQAVREPALHWQQTLHLCSSPESRPVCVEK